MSDFNIMEQVKHSLQKYSDLRNRNFRDEDINTETLKLKPSKVKWSNESLTTPEGINSTVTVEKNALATNSAEALHQIHTEKESDVIGRVTLEQGLIKGLNKMMVLPLVGSKLKDILGESVRINLGKRVTELKNDKMTIAVSIEVGGRSASAAINTQKVIYKGNFECDVTLSGRVIIQGPDGEVFQQNISSMLSTDVQHIKGTIEFLWDKQQNVNY